MPRKAWKLVTFQYFSLNELALGTYGYSWREDGAKHDSPYIRVVISKYNRAHIDPAAKQFNVSTGYHDGKFYSNCCKAC